MTEDTNLGTNTLEDRAYEVHTALTTKEVTAYTLAKAGGPCINTLQRAVFFHFEDWGYKPETVERAYNALLGLRARRAAQREKLQSLYNEAGVVRPDRVINAIRVAKISVEDIANTSGVSEQTLRMATKYNDKWNPKWYTLAALVKAVDILLERELS